MNALSLSRPENFRFGKFSAAAKIGYRCLNCAEIVPKVLKNGQKSRQTA